MSGEVLITFNIVGIVGALTCIAQGLGRYGEWWMLAFGYVFLGLNVFLLLGNLGGAS